MKKMSDVTTRYFAFPDEPDDVIEILIPDAPAAAKAAETTIAIILETGYREITARQAAKYLRRPS